MKELVIDSHGEVRQAGADASGAWVQKLKLAAERDLFVFAKYIMDQRDLVRLHREVCSFLVVPEPHRKMLLLPRDTYKTTILKCLVAHTLIQPGYHNIYFPGREGSDTRLLYAAETAGMAQARISWVRRAFEENKWIRAFWPHRTWEDARSSKATWNQDAWTIPRGRDFDEASVESVGVGGAIVGHHYDVIIKDDLVGREAANSSLVMASAIDWHIGSRSLFNDFTTAREYILGTRWAVHDLYSHIEKSESHMGRYIRKLIEDGECIFPERFPPEVIEDLQKQGQLFYLNYMNSIEGSNLTDFDTRLVREFTINGDEVYFDEAVADATLRKTFENPLTASPEAPGADYEGSLLKPGSPLDARRYRVLRGGGNVGLVLRFS